MQTCMTRYGDYEQVSQTLHARTVIVVWSFTFSYSGLGFRIGPRTKSWFRLVLTLFRYFRVFGKERKNPQIRGRFTSLNERVQCRYQWLRAMYILGLIDFWKLKFWSNIWRFAAKHTLSCSNLGVQQHCHEMNMCPIWTTNEKRAYKYTSHHTNSVVYDLFALVISTRFESWLIPIFKNNKRLWVRSFTLLFWVPIGPRTVFRVLVFTSYNNERY